MTNTCNCKTCKKVKARIKELSELTYDTMIMNKQRMLEDLEYFLK